MPNSSCGRLARPRNTRRSQPPHCATDDCNLVLTPSIRKSLPNCNSHILKFLWIEFGITPTRTTSIASARVTMSLQAGATCVFSAGPPLLQRSPARAPRRGFG